MVFCSAIDSSRTSAARVKMSVRSFAINSFVLVYSKSRSNKGDKKRQKFAGDFFMKSNKYCIFVILCFYQRNLRSIVNNKFGYGIFRKVIAK